MNKLINANDIHRRERDGFQYIEVMVFCYDVSGIGYYRTIHELVVIICKEYVHANDGNFLLLSRSRCRPPKGGLSLPRLAGRSSRTQLASVLTTSLGI